MEQIERINATKARNRFFELLKKSFLERRSYIVEKGQIPMVYIIPFTTDGANQKETEAVLAGLKKLRRSMTRTSDSVALLREIRKYGR